MLLVKDHQILLSVQYLVHCLDTENVCHHITAMDHPPREMKEILFTSHNQTVVLLLQHDGQQSIKLSTTTYQWQENLSDETTTGHSVTAPLRSLQALELLQKVTEVDWLFKLSRLWNGSAGCSSLVQLHCSPHRHLKIYETDQSRRYANWTF